MLLDEIKRLLELLHEFSEIFLVDDDRLADKAFAFRSSLAFYHIEEHVTIDVLFHIKEIGPVVLDKPRRKNFSTLSHGYILALQNVLYHYALLLAYL